MRRITPFISDCPADNNSPKLQEAAACTVGLRRRRGATAMEYLFVISLILTVAITGIGYFGQSTKNTTQKASDAIQNATTGK